MAGSLVQDVLMPAYLDLDGRIAWWALATIARHNGNAPQHGWTLITSAEVWTWGDAEWEQLAADTPEIYGPITAGQRDRIREDLFELEREDLTEPEPWWDR